MTTSDRPSGTELRASFDERFYEKINDGSVRSARAVLGLLYDVYKPKSVIDVGCGSGAWLSVAESLGSTTLVGLDGGWVDPEKLVSRSIRFRPIDFDVAIPLEGRFDLAMSLEVIEHLEEHRARPFVETLCEASDVVLFSGAIKGQGGVRHINEQWQSFWIQLFHESDYACLDVLRGLLWHDESVEWWYRQNAFLFVKRGSPVIDVRELVGRAVPVYDVVHPILFTARQRKYEQALAKLQKPTLRSVLELGRKYLVSKAQGIISMHRDA
jgi:SAM-dependent methyltransferase